MNSDQILDVLTRKGVLINLTVRYWRATKKLKPEDLGLNPDNVSDRLISLGHKKLLPRERLKPFALIESRAHALVEASSFRFLNGLGRFMPNAKLQDVTVQLGEYERQFMQAKSEFIAHYSELREEAYEDWMVAAGQLVDNPEHLVAAILASFPMASSLHEYFRFDVQLFHIRVPEAVELEITSTEEQQQIVEARNQAAREAARKIHEEADAFVSDCVVTLRNETASLCEGMLESIRTSKTGVHQKTLNRLIRFIDRFRSLNFVGDRQMEEQLENVRRELLEKSAEDYRDDGSAKERLQEGLRGLAATARELAQQDNAELVERFGRMGQRKFHLIALNQKNHNPERPHDAGKGKSFPVSGVFPFTGEKHESLHDHTDTDQGHRSAAFRLRGTEPRPGEKRHGERLW